MFKRSHLGLAIAAAIAIPATGYAEIETSVVLKNETAVFLNEGQRTGEAASMLDKSAKGQSIGKFENSATIFMNDDIGEESSWHAEVKLIHDAAAISGYKGYKRFSQHDWLRELYVDTTAGDWDLRLGKQQVVWGTADGIKLLDIINPTDFREMSQNSMEESRIPIWMVNAERNVGDNGNFQFIVSQAEENKIPGLGSDSDPGHPFIMKGVDSISGRVNGFYNVTPALSNVAGSFNNAALAGMFTGGLNTAGLLPFGGLTVDGFAMNPNVVAFPCTAPGVCGAPTAFGPGHIVLNNIAQNGLAAGDSNGNNNVTNLTNVSGPLANQVTWDPSNPTSAFEYMANATFATFNTFTQWTGAPGASGITGIGTQWKRDYDNTPNLGGRFRSSLDNGLNYSLNYFYHYSANPAVDLSWHDANTGEELNVVRAATSGTGMPNPGIDRNRNQVLSALRSGNNTTILLRNNAGQFYGAFDPATGLPNGGNTTPAALRFTEYSDRVHSFGSSFDYAVDAGSLPVVLRGEFLYDKGEKQPVVDRLLLSVGDLSNALKMEDADYFKYVLGVDVTVFTNMLASFQFIQFRNLDYIDQNCSVATQGGNTVNCSRYSADFATLHMSNDLHQAQENKEFYSFFVSKPFGEAQLGRVNNIVIYEEGGGFWDRIDAEYSLTDEVILTGELNAYWGDENTTFGQFQESSSAQIGVKWILE